MPFIESMMEPNGKEQSLGASTFNVEGRIFMPMTDAQKILKELGRKVEVR